MEVKVRLFFLVSCSQKQNDQLEVERQKYVLNVIIFIVHSVELNILYYEVQIKNVQIY